MSCYAPSIQMICIYENNNMINHLISTEEKKIKNYLKKSQISLNNNNNKYNYNLNHFADFQNYSFNNIFYALRLRNLNIWASTNHESIIILYLNILFY